MKTIVCFIRHGLTNVNIDKRIQGRQDHPLSDEGILQATETGNYLKKYDSHWDVIYSSPLVRAYDTACIIKNILNLQCDIIKEKDFIERDFGDAEGEKISKEIFDRLLNKKIKNVESNEEIQERVINCLLEKVSLNEGKKILIVAHSHTIKALLTFLDPKRTFMDLLYNCSMNYFSIEENKITIEKVNLIPNKNS